MHGGVARRSRNQESGTQGGEGSRAGTGNIDPILPITTTWTRKKLNRTHLLQRLVVLSSQTPDPGPCQQYYFPILYEKGVWLAFKYHSPFLDLSNSIQIYFLSHENVTGLLLGGHFHILPALTKLSISKNNFLCPLQECSRPKPTHYHISCFRCTLSVV